MIVYFPEENKISTYIENHQYIFVLPFLVIDVILFTLFYFNGYDVKPLIVNESQLYEICQLNNVYGLVFLGLIIGYKILILLLILLLIYIEWGIIEIHTDIQCFITVIYIDILSLILLRIIDFISINNYKIEFLIRILIILIVVIANYILLYGFRFLISFIKNSNEEFKLNVNNVHNANKNTNSNNITYSSNKEINSSKTSFISKIVEYHNKSSI